VDASLGPTMNRYRQTLSDRFVGAAFKGRPFMVTSQGGVMDAREVAAPIHALNSGPAMVPVAERHYARRDFDRHIAIVADARC
jgi:N-methylhydantoinase A